jgi:hypothetical protein
MRVLLFEIGAFDRSDEKIVVSEKEILRSRRARIRRQGAGLPKPQERRA